jgi:hypothetical protein
MTNAVLVHFSPKENRESILQNGLQSPVLRSYEELRQKYEERIRNSGLSCDSLEEIYRFFDLEWTHDSCGGKYIISVTLDPPAHVNTQLSNIVQTHDKWYLDFDSILERVERVFVNINKYPILIHKHEIIDSLPYMIRDFGSWTEEPELYAFEKIPHVFIQMKSDRPSIPPRFLTLYSD